MSVAIDQTRSIGASMVIVSEALSAMALILPDRVLLGGDSAAPRFEATVVRRPESVEPKPEHRHEKPDCERRSRIAVGAVWARERGGESDDDLDRERQIHHPGHR